MGWFEGGLDFFLQLFVLMGERGDSFVDDCEMFCLDI